MDHLHFDVAPDKLNYACRTPSQSTKSSTKAGSDIIIITIFVYGTACSTPSNV